jgi:phosphate:Na+ symporter
MDYGFYDLLQLLGALGVFLFGMKVMSDSLLNLAGNKMRSILASMTSNRFLGIFTGFFITSVIQSSSATMALTLIMCAQGWIPFEMAAAMVLGENVGTTITANLAALVANYKAKQTARAHLIFNIIGVVWMLILFYPFLKFIGWLSIHFGSESPYITAAAIPVAIS